MEEKSKLNTIVDAFTSKLPKDEDWYKKRLSICSSCEYNSKNVGGVVLNLKDIVGASCTACGCFIDRKAAMREEECGLVEKNLPPKWDKLSIITSKKDNYNLHNNSPDTCKVYLNGDDYFLDFGKVEYDVVISAQILLEGNGVVTSTSVSCGCTTPTKKILSSTLTQLDVSIKTKNYKNGSVKTIACGMSDGSKVVIKVKATS